MKRYFWSVALGAALVLAAGCLFAGCGESSKPPTTPKPKATAMPTGMPMTMPTAKPTAPAAPAAAIAQKVCPVMGGKIDPNIYLDYQGRRIYFCCNACPEAFKKDPEKYLKKLDAELAGTAASPVAAPH